MIIDNCKREWDPSMGITKYAYWYTAMIEAQGYEDWQAVEECKCILRELETCEAIGG